MQNSIETFINNWGYLGIFLITAIETAIPFIPSEITLTLIGFLTLTTKLNIYEAITISTIGALFGAVVLYWIGTFLTQDRLIALTNLRISKLFHLTEENIKKTEDFFGKYEKYAVFFGRFVPVVRALISLPAGMTKMSFIWFVVLTTIGSLIWNAGLIFLGRVAGSAYATVAHSFSNILIVVILVVIISGVGYYFLKRKNTK